MVVLSAGVLVSDCCHAVAACADDDCSAYQCTQCSKPCTASESLGQYHDRLEAPKRERERLEREVVEAAKSWYENYHNVGGSWGPILKLRDMVAALNRHESQHGEQK